ncbi:MAG: ArsR/SmtB family transcription factor, partial [Ktedonobacterales bacterium]
VHRGDLAMLPPAEVTTLTAVAHALSDPARLQMLWLLEQREELCTCEFEEVLALGQSRVSYHLKLLLDAGLLVRRRRGTWNHYRLARRGLLACVRALVPSVAATNEVQTEKETQDGSYTIHR